MSELGMSPRVDEAGNLIGRRIGSISPQAGLVNLQNEPSNLPTLLIGSHLDTIPAAGRYDGILGVMMALAVVRAIGNFPLPFHLDVIGFSEEEGVRFLLPYLGSRALIGTFDPAWLSRVDDDGHTMRDVIETFGLQPEKISSAAYPVDRVAGFIEPHIEQGPILSASKCPVAVVDAIVGQSRLQLEFRGQANHAGTTPMSMRRDALVAASKWITEVSRYGNSIEGLRATVGALNLSPNARNAVPGLAQVSLDVRHADDSVRTKAVNELCDFAKRCASADDVAFSIIEHQQQPAVAMDSGLVTGLQQSVAACGVEPCVMPSGAGHDSVVMAETFPTVMLFVRQPTGLSHHPDEDVEVGDVAVAIDVLQDFVRRFTPSTGKEFRR